MTWQVFAPAGFASFLKAMPKVNGGDYKLMGLAPYGEQKYVSLIKEKVVEIRDDGSIRMKEEQPPFDDNADWRSEYEPG